MLFSWKDGRLAIKVTLDDVRHAANIEGHRPLGRKLTDHEVAQVLSTIDTDALKAAYHNSDNPEADNDHEAHNGAIAAFHVMVSDAVTGMCIAD
jgi:hypothetical protein